MTSAREEILGRIREALGDVPRSEGPEDVPVERGYVRSEPDRRAVLVERFIERVAEYKAHVLRVASAELPGAIASALAARGIQRLVVPQGIPAEWLPPGIRALADDRLSHEVLDGSDGVLTTCALGIAQTGTIVLDGGPGQGRRALTLLPDYHLCVVRDDQIVGNVPEAVAQLRAVANRPITWISGPSATSDIELNRVEGVHGPRTLEVVVVGTQR